MDHHSDILDTPIVETAAPEIYSSKAISAFTFFFSAIFGGIMAYQNLVRVGKKTNAIQVLIAGFAWVIAVGTLSYFVTIPPYFALFLNITAAWGMGHYVSGVYIPGHQNMPKRKIWVPLAIGLTLLGIAISIIFYTLQNE